LNPSPAFRKNKVRCAVDDAGNPLDSIGCQSFAQRLDDRYSAGDRRLESHHYAFLLSSKKNLVAVKRK